MPLLSAKQQIAIKQEATAGSAETLAASHVVLHTGLAEYEANIEITPREAMSASLSPRGSVVGTHAAKIRWKQYLRGTATAPVASSNEPDFSVPFKGCGAQITVSTPGGAGTEQSSFKPTTSLVSDETTGAYCTVGLYQDGKRYLLTGAVGNCVLNFTVGQPPLAEFEFTGVYNAPSTTALLSPTYPATISAAYKSGSFTEFLGGGEVFIKSFRLDFGNTISMRPAPSAATGIAMAQIVSRRPSGSFDPEEFLAGVTNWWVGLTAGTQGAIALQCGGTNYNTIQVNIPNAKYTKVGLADRDGIVTAPVDFECVANSNAGDDEWELIQT